MSSSADIKLSCARSTLSRIWLAFVRRLFQLQLIDQRCSSLLAGRSVTLSKEVVRGATGLHIECTLLWPIFLPRFRPPLVSLQFVRHDLGRIPPIPRCKQFWRETHLSLDIMTTAVSEDLALQIVRIPDGRPLREIRFTALDMKRVACELCVSNAEIYAVDQGRRIRCDCLHDKVDHVLFRLDLRLTNLEHCRFLTQVCAELQTEVAPSATAASGSTTWRNRLEFDGGEALFEQPLGPTENLIRAGFGEHILKVRLGDTVLVEKKFRLIPRNEMLRNTRSDVVTKTELRTISIMAVNHRGAAVPLEVVAEDFPQIKVTPTLEVPQLAPLVSEIDLSMACTIRRGKTERLCHRVPVLLRAGSQRLELFLTLPADLFDPGPGRYHLEVWLGDRVLKSVFFVHQTRAQLKAAQAELILHSLRISEPRLLVVRDHSQLETDDVFATDEALVTAFTITGQGFDEEVPMIKWRLNVRLIDTNSGDVHQEFCFLQAKAGPNSHELRWPLHGADRELASGRYAFQLVKRDVVLTEFQFRMLAMEEIAPYTRQLILSNVRAENPQLLIQAGGIRYQASQIPDSSDFLLPQFTLLSAGCNSILPEIETQLHLVLIGEGDKRQSLITLPVTLSSRPLPLHNLAVKVRDGSLGSNPGLHRLGVEIGERSILEFSFQIVSESEVLACVSVSDLVIVATGRSGRKQRNPNSILLSEKPAIDLEATIRTTLLAPNMTVHGILLFRFDRTTVAQAKFDLGLSNPSQTIRARRVNLESMISDNRTTERELVAVVVIAGQEKATRSLRIFCGSLISNFEGQLRSDAAQNPLDEAEYERIVGRL